MEGTESGRDGEVQALIAQRRIDDALARTNDVDALRGLEGQAAAVQQYVRKLNATLDQQNQLAEARIRIARKIGRVLQSTVKRGGRGSKSLDATSKRGGSSAPLPDGITRSQSSRYQRLARIADEHLERFFAECSEAAREISVVGLLSACSKWEKANAASPGRKKRPLPAVTQPSDLSPIWSAVNRLLVPDVAIGVPSEVVGARRALGSDSTDVKKVEGRVVAALREDIGKWIEVLSDRARVSEALAVVPAVTGAVWFKLLEQYDWICCFPAERTRVSAVVVVYTGDRKHGFWLAFRDLGCVLGALRF